jgi:hypothetical protein
MICHPTTRNDSRNAKSGQIFRRFEGEFCLHPMALPCHALPVTNEIKQKKNPAAVALGRLGGLKGGPARTASMTPAQRKAAALKAALARWSKKSKKP